MGGKELLALSIQIQLWGWDDPGLALTFVTHPIRYNKGEESRELTGVGNSGHEMSFLSSL